MWNPLLYISKCDLNFFDLHNKVALQWVERSRVF